MVYQSEQGRPNTNTIHLDDPSIKTPINIEIVQNNNGKCSNNGENRSTGKNINDNHMSDGYDKLYHDRPFPYNSGFVPAYDTFSDSIYRPYDCPTCHQSAPGESYVLPPPPVGSIPVLHTPPAYPHPKTYENIPLNPYVPMSCPSGKCPVCPVQENKPWSEYKTLENDLKNPPSNSYVP